MYKKIVEEGHTLGMHSYSHKYSVIYDSMSAFEQDFNQIHDYLKEVTGVDCKYYRFPGGSSNQVSNSDMREFIRYLNDRGLHTMIGMSQAEMRHHRHIQRMS